MWRIGRKEGRGCRPKQAGVANIHGLRLDPGGNAASALATDDSREAEQRLLMYMPRFSGEGAARED